ncbi:hypothetical protein EVAR_43570_1 [Eumeta japonica]|uniref:Reverse transcriptase domain-containing protein n=1 Tax=Eumeta variegata TaxID=151549 RepID=A0A4C1XEM4_EUMVA|nr:hypothetical protein EVAR_43570_1 [Eumeta japonica]
MFPLRFRCASSKYRHIGLYCFIICLDLKSGWAVIDKLSVKCFLYTDDQVIIRRRRASCAVCTVAKTHESTKGRGLKVNVSGTEVIVFERGESTSECDVFIELDSPTDEFVYLGSLFTNDGNHDKNIESKVNAGNKATGAFLAALDASRRDAFSAAHLQTLAGPPPRPPRHPSLSSLIRVNDPLTD